MNKKIFDIFKNNNYTTYNYDNLIINDIDNYDDFFKNK